MIAALRGSAYLYHKAQGHDGISAIMYGRAVARSRLSCPRKSKIMHFWEIAKRPLTLDVMDLSTGFAGRVLTAAHVSRRSSVDVSTAGG
jgi:hypothetical protein